MEGLDLIGTRDSSAARVAPFHSLRRVRSPMLLENQVSLESRTYTEISSHCSKTGGGPLIRFHFKFTFTSTRLAILTKGTFLFIP